jgi:aerobic C4-dicarboxylate transport protein
MIIASKGAAGVTGAGLATLAGGLSAHRPDLLDGVGLIVGIDRFMSEARALTNFAGNAIATVLVATWTNQLDRDQLLSALSGEDPFDEATMIDDHGDALESGTNAGPGRRVAEDGTRGLAETSPH